MVVDGSSYFDTPLSCVGRSIMSNLMSSDGPRGQADPHDIQFSTPQQMKSSGSLIMLCRFLLSWSRHLSFHSKVSITAFVAALAKSARPLEYIEPLTSTTMTKSLGPVEPEEYLRASQKIQEVCLDSTCRLQRCFVCVLCPNVCIQYSPEFLFCGFGEVCTFCIVCCIHLLIFLVLCRLLSIASLWFIKTTDPQTMPRTDHPEVPRYQGRKRGS